MPRDANRGTLIEAANPFDEEKELEKSLLSLWRLKYLFYESSLLRALWTIFLAFLSKFTQRKSITFPLLIVLYIHLMIFFLTNIGIPAIVGCLNLKLTLKHNQFLQPFQDILDECGFPKGHALVYEGMENAFTIGIGRFAIIVIGTGLVDSLHLTTSEMIAIVAHELGHWHYDHICYVFILYAIIIGCATTLFVFMMRNKSFYKSFDISTDKGIPFGVGLILFTGLAQLLLFFLKPLMNSISHLHEYQADAFSASLGHGHHLIEGFKKSHPLVLKLADPLYGLFVYTHPVFSKRIAAVASVISKFKGRRR
jgi:STE24 endopeptidase